MTLKEFDEIRPYLPKNINIQIEFPTKSLASLIEETSTSTLIKETWGNHDGRYNMKCCKCGWQSHDIRPGETEPEKCPKCN